MQEKFTYEKNIEQRIDVFLYEMYANLFSRMKIQDKITKNLVTVNDESVKKNYILEAGDVVIIKKEFFDNEVQDLSKLKPADIELDIIFEDEHLLVINKQAGLCTHPGNSNQNNTLTNALVGKYGISGLSDAGGIERLGIVHRLDKDTSGLMVVAKNNKTHERLSKQIQEKVDFHREYIAICHGVPMPASGNIELYMKKGSYADGRMIICDENDSKAKISETYYEVAETFANGLGSAIKCKLFTGRTHQIRLHLSHIGHTIVGDKIYTSRNSVKYMHNMSQILKNVEFHALCSYKLQFKHPITRKLLSFSVNLPKHMLEIIEKLKNHDA